MSSYEEIRTIALTEFALAGYNATSLQRIAEIAGLSKSSVLYHFASKEALLDAAITPAIDRMDRTISSIEGQVLTPERRREFIVEFVDFMLDHRSEVHVFINQGRSLRGLPVVERANSVVVRMATFFCTVGSSTEDQMRFAVALGGTAYTLASQGTLTPVVSPVNETRAALITIMTELLSPVSASPADPAPSDSAPSATSALSTPSLSASTVLN
jgi:AcrR family transcriptional regulator